MTMDLGALTAALAAADPEQVVPVGFARPHSYRGYYNDLAFEPVANARVGDMLAAARESLGKTFNGYKGGEYRMDECVLVYLAYYGDTGEEIGPVLLSYMLGTPTVPVRD